MALRYDVIGLSTDFLHCGLCAAGFAWGPETAYEVRFFGCASWFVGVNHYDMERSVQTSYKVPVTCVAFPALAQMVLGLVVEVTLFCDEIFVAGCAHVFHVVHFDMSVVFTVTFRWCHPRVAR